MTMTRTSSADFALGTAVLIFTNQGRTSLPRIDEFAIRTSLSNKAISISDDLGRLIKKKGGSPPPTDDACGQKSDMASILGFVKDIVGVVKAAACAALLLTRFEHNVNLPSGTKLNVELIASQLTMIEEVGKKLDEEEEQEKTDEDEAKESFVEKSLKEDNPTSNEIAPTSSSKKPVSTTATMSATWASSFQTSITSSVASHGQSLVILNSDVNSAMVTQANKAISGAIGSSVVYSFLPKFIPGDGFWVISGIDAKQSSSIQSVPGVNSIVPNDLIVAEVLDQRQEDSSPTENEPTETQDEEIIYTGTSYFGAPDLLPRQISQRMDRVEAIMATETQETHVERKKLQKRVERAFHLQSLSQPKDIQDRRMLGDDEHRGYLDYVYNSKAGDGVLCYMIDGHVDVNHPEFEDGILEPFMYGPSFAANQYEEFNTVIGHSTAMASLIGGARLGVAKKIKIVPVKVRLAVIDFYWVFRAIHDDIRERRAQGRGAEPGKVVVWCGWAFPEDYANQQYMYAFMYQALKNLMNDDVVVVQAAGNHYNDMGPDTSISEVPQVWASADFPIIVVAAADRFGEGPWETKTGPQVTCWSIGRYIKTAREGSQGYAHYSGTCCASAIAAGLVGYFLSLNNPPFITGYGRTAYNVRDYFASSGRFAPSYVREGGSVPVIWNREDGFAWQREEYCETPGHMVKRVEVRSAYEGNCELKSMSKVFSTTSITSATLSRKVTYSSAASLRSGAELLISPGPPEKPTGRVDDHGSYSTLTVPESSETLTPSASSTVATTLMLAIVLRDTDSYSHRSSMKFDPTLSNTPNNSPSNNLRSQSMLQAPLSTVEKPALQSLTRTSSPTASMTADIPKILAQSWSAISSCTSPAPSINGIPKFTGGRCRVIVNQTLTFGQSDSDVNLLIKVKDACEAVLSDLEISIAWGETADTMPKALDPLVLYVIPNRGPANSSEAAVVGTYGRTKNDTAVERHTTISQTMGMNNDEEEGAKLHQEPPFQENSSQQEFLYDEVQFLRGMLGDDETRIVDRWDSRNPGRCNNGAWKNITMMNPMSKSRNQTWVLPTRVIDCWFLC